jgi:calcineurin-like phosphoesterase family protein
MNTAIIQQWNEQVSPSDTIYLLGDFAMGPRSRHQEFRAALNGRIILVRGNHDASPTRLATIGFHEVYESLTIQAEGIGQVLMQHHPPKTDDSIGADLVLCGHVHDSWVTRRTKSGTPIINVGIDAHWLDGRIQLLDLEKIKGLVATATQTLDDSETY